MRLDGNALREARERLGYSIETTAEVAGVAKNSVLRAEHEGDVRPVTARKIANALEVRVGDLRPKDQPPLPFNAVGSGDAAREENATAERRVLYLSFALDEARSYARQANWMLNEVESFGESPAELTGWSWRITGLLSSIWALQQRWETHVSAPTSEQALADWERSLLEQITEEFAKAEALATRLRERFSRELNERDEQVQQEAKRGIAQIQSYIATEQQQAQDPGAK